MLSIVLHVIPSGFFFYSVTDIIVFNGITFFVAGYSAAAKAAKYGTLRVFC